MKSAEDIAWEIVPECNTIPVQGNPEWLREDITNVLDPLLLVMGNLITDEGQCRLCCEENNHGRLDNGESCPAPDALGVVR